VHLSNDQVIHHVQEESLLANQSRAGSRPTWDKGCGSGVETGLTLESDRSLNLAAGGDRHDVLL
jgi:hypothetical protein